MPACLEVPIDTAHPLARQAALGIAIGLWSNASLQDRLVSSERLVEAGISYNSPRGFIIINHRSGRGAPFSGKKAPDNNQIGIKMRFMMA